MVSSLTLFSQSQLLHFDNKPILEVIEDIEKSSNFVFNYDPEQLLGYYFSGSIDRTNVTQALTQILRESPFIYEVNQQTILVYQAEPRKYRICGTIKDLKTREALIAASISVNQTSIGCQSDLDGYFELTFLALKNQKVDIRYLGYHTYSFLVEDRNELDCTVFNMKVDEEIFGSEIIIKDYILDGIMLGHDYGSFDLDFDQLSKNHSNVEHDILKTAQLLPGINSVDDSATNLQIRGSQADQNLILWEGAPVYNAGHIFGMISAINPFSVDRVRIFKGAHDPKYDHRVGGIIDISDGDSIVQAFHGSIGSTLTEAHTHLDIPIIKNHLSLMLSGRHSFNNLYQSPPLQSYTNKVFQLSIIDDQSEDAEEGGINTEQMLAYHDWNAKLLFNPTKRIKLNLGYYSNQQDFQYLFSFPEDPFLSKDKITVGTKVANAVFDLLINDRWSALLSLHHSTYKNRYLGEEFELGEKFNEYHQFNSIIDKGITFSNLFTLSPIVSFKAGYEYNVKDVHLDLADDIQIDSDFNPFSHELVQLQSLFLSLGVSKKKWLMDAGMRTSYDHSNLRWTHSPRVNLKYLVDDRWTLKADGGIYHQFISQFSSFGSRDIRVDNPLWIMNAEGNSLSQKANKLAAGFVFRNKGWLLDVDAYYNYTTGINTMSNGLGLLAEQFGFSKGTSTVRGIDFMLKKRWLNLNTWINYSYAQARHNFFEIADEPYFAPNDIRHNLSFVTSYKIGNIQLSMNANYHSGLPYSKPDVVPNEIDKDPEPPFTHFLNYNDFNNDRLNPYLRFDINLNYRLRFGRLSQYNVECSLSMINVFNNENVIERGYYLTYPEESFIPDLASVDNVLLRRTPLLLVRFYW